MSDFVFGLPRHWLAVLNVGAVLLVFGMFYQDRRDVLKIAAEDREMFRAELREQRRALDHMSSAINKLAKRLEAK